MQEPDDGLLKHFRGIETGRQENPELSELSELTELAYQMEHADPGDPELLKRLVARYAADLYNWISALIYYRYGYFFTQAEILAILKITFKKAITAINDFHGEESISAWLFGIAYDCMKRFKRIRSSLSGDLPDVPAIQTATESPDPLSPNCDILDRIPNRLQPTLLLKYLFDFEIPQVADILSLRPADVHHRLVDGRRRLSVKPFKSHREIQLQAYLDGLLDKDIEAVNALNQHIASCDACQNRVEQINEQIKSLSDSLHSQWVSAPLGDAILNQLVLSVLDELNQLETGWKLNFRFRQAAWMLSLAVAFVGMSIIFVRFTNVEEEFQQALNSPTQISPPTAENQSSILLSQNSTDIPVDPQYIEPAFSSDGSWAVFAVVQPIPTSWRRSVPTIELYNRQSATIQVISQSDGRSDKPWIWWDLSPSISGDGRLIAYVSTTQDPNVAGDPCQTQDNNNCLDVFLYDRETDQTRRLTQAINGGPADGDSLAPTISGDGHWVAFWSTADNLVNGFTNQCQRGGTSVTCLYIYLYHLDTGSIDWIPIPNFPGNPVYGVDKISLSADGRYVGFTVTPTILGGIPSACISSSPKMVEKMPDIGISNTSIPDIIHCSEALVYDRETARYEIENQAQDGTQGDGESSSPVLSADGRFVAFASLSTNIFTGSRNGYSNVFLRDRNNGEVELISNNPTDWTGRSDSGLSYIGNAYYSLNISGDGRYVVFESTATNLGQYLPVGCNEIDNSRCHFLYVHDRQSGINDRITALPGPDFIFFPEISSDGRWVTFMQSSHTCSAPQFLCSNVMLYDRQRKWMTNLTQNDLTISKPGWSYSNSLVLPWQTWDRGAFAFSPDGKFIALAGADSQIRIWQFSGADQPMNNVEPNTILGENGELFSALAFSADSQWIAGGTTSGSVYIWQLSEGKLLYSTMDLTSTIEKLSFSQDGAFLVISTLNGASIWNLPSEQLLSMNNNTAEYSGIKTADISTGGNMLVTARNDGSVWIQEIPAGKIIGKMNPNRQIDNNVAISEDGTLIAIRTSDGVINVWEMEQTVSESPSFIFIKTFHSYIYDGALTFSPDNKYLASSGMAGDVTLWSLPDGVEVNLTTATTTGIAYSLAFSNDGNKLASVFENEIVLWALHPDKSSRYFVHTITDRFFDSNPLPTPTATDILALQSQNSNRSSYQTLEQVVGKIDFPLNIPSRLPENFTFSTASVNSDGSILLQYDTNPQEYQASLYIYEKYIGDTTPPTMTVGTGADVLPTQIEIPAGSSTAEYVQGDWKWSLIFTPLGEYSGKATTHEIVDWDFTSNSQRLRWQQDGILIALYYQFSRIYTPVLPTPVETSRIVKLSPILDQSDLEQIASGMLPFSGVSHQTGAHQPGNSPPTGMNISFNINSTVNGQDSKSATIVELQKVCSVKLVTR